MKNPRMATQMRDLMRRSGFTDVDQTILTLPTCGWADPDDGLALPFAEYSKQSVSRLMRMRRNYSERHRNCQQGERAQASVVAGHIPVHSESPVRDPLARGETNTDCGKA